MSYQYPSQPNVPNQGQPPRPPRPERSAAPPPPPQQQQRPDAVVGGLGIIQPPPAYPPQPPYLLSQPQPYQAPPTYPLTQPTYQAPPVQVRAPAPGTNTAVIVLLSILLTAVVGGGGYFLLTHGSGGPAPSQPLSIAGVWDITLSYQSGSSAGEAFQGQMTVQHNGTQLTAQLTANIGIGISLAGTISGQSVTLSRIGCVDDTNQGDTCSYTLTGTVADSSHMTGTFTFQNSYSDGTSENSAGTWSATKTAS